MSQNYGPVGGNPSPFGSGDPYYNESSGFIRPQPASSKRNSSTWLKVGIPVAALLILGAVLGGVLGSRSSKSQSRNDSASASAAASSDASLKLKVGRFATGTNSYMMPVYPSTTNSAAFTTPTFKSSALSWPKDSFQPQTPSVLNVRPDRPRLIATNAQWQALPSLIQADPYLKGWNDTIFGNASAYDALPPVVYFLDGPSGILDNARDVKRRVKTFAYAYRMSNNTRWVDRTWREIQNAAGNGTTPFGNDTDRWNNQHFLDTAELTAAFGIAYDWLYSLWSDEQKSQIRFTMIKYGLQPGLDAVNNPATGWWRTNTTGNWNCVCNSGLTLGALAILGDDTTGVAERILGLTVDNAKSNCANAIVDDGVPTETANYWYFATTGHAEMSSALLTATGSDYGLLDVNTNFFKTGLYHMYAYGPTSLFDYGDHGPNKYSASANAMFLYGKHYNQPQYVLFQREQFDAADPWSMVWYDPAVSGAFWDGLPLDHFFDNRLGQMVSMRSSWTDNNAMFVAMKAGMNQGHQTHNDLDCGDFVLDALGTRWAGEFGNSDYLAQGYFSSDAQNSVRWQYYRKMTEGQNTILINQANQNVLAAPTVKHDSSGTSQGSSTVMDVPRDSTAYWITDISSAYVGGDNVKRGVRFLNGRRQVLIQDEITSQSALQWRMHTNATVNVNDSGKTATLALAGQTLNMVILSPSDATFTTSAAVRFPSDPTPPAPDPENPGVTVVIISRPAGTHNIQVLFNPQWSGMSSNDFVTPSSVSLDNWSLTSHN